MATKLRMMVDAGMDHAGVSRSQLISMMGWKNINKGLRKLDAYVDQLQALDSEFEERMASVLGLPVNALKDAFTASNDDLSSQLKADFRPCVFIRIKEQIFPLVARWHASQYLRVNVPENAITGDLMADFDHVIKLFRIQSKHPILLKFHLEGFTYHRQYDETYEFDRKGRLIR